MLRSVCCERLWYYSVFGVEFVCSVVSKVCWYGAWKGDGGKGSTVARKGASESDLQV